jgi:phosphonate transport system substrate-binding protein
VRSNHEANVLAVVEGTVDLATVSSAVYERLFRDNPDVEKNTRVLWQSPPIPSDPLLWKMSLSLETKTVIRDYFLGLGQDRLGKDARSLAEERKTLDRLGVKSFVVSDNNQLQPIRLLDAVRSAPD